MNNTSRFATAIRFNHTNNTIELTKSFEKAASRFGTDEFCALQEARSAYPNYRVVIASRKSKSDSFKGLTYEYMKNYIASHDDEEKSIMAEYENMIGTSEEAKELQMKAVSYGELKKWFLATYPNIKAFCEKREQLLTKNVA